MLPQLKEDELDEAEKVYYGFPNYEKKEKDLKVYAIRLELCEEKL